MRQGELSWRDRGRLWMRLTIRFLLVLLFVLGMRYLAPTLLGLFMPFVLALIVSWFLNPLVKSLQRRLGLPRGILSILLILLAFAAIGGILFGLGSSLASEIRSLVENWEEIWVSLQGGVLTLGEELDKLLAYIPHEVETFINENLDKLYSWLSQWVNWAIVEAGNRAKNVAFSLPSFVVSLIVFIMATYFITADYPRLRMGVTDRLSKGVREFFSHIKRTALGAFGGYVRAELIISMCVFVILLVGFLIIGQGYAVLLALVLSVLDFIPLIGSGTIMLPWAVVDLLSGNVGHGLGLAIVWSVVCLFRRVAEPKVVGSQTGLSPVLSLVSMYIGMKLAGVLGMILGPILCMVAINICRTGIFDGLCADLKLAAKDVAALLHVPPPSGGEG